jgi:hypothetical protein
MITWIDISCCIVLQLLGGWKLWEILVIFGKRVEGRLSRPRINRKNLAKYRATHKVFECCGIKFHGKIGDKCSYCDTILK